jgi:predicted phage terminase large subunit-like protein
VEIRPQPGAQSRFLSSQADICVYGGSAGSGKTFALLLEPLRHIHVPGFGGTIFRREAKELSMEGGLISKAMSLYPYLGAVYRSQPAPSFTFPSGAKISFGHLNQENEVMAWKGAEICYIAFDEVDGFSDFQVMYMQSRNRSTCGVRPYIRCSCNPSADSWLAKYLEWWIDQETGYPIQERSGAIRYLIRVDGERIWADSREELMSAYGCDYNDPKSVSFIPAKITDNPILLKKDPGYLANLKGLSRVERARLLDGNWLVRAQAGDYFPRGDVEIIDWIPTDVVKWVRSWDLAATEEGEARDPDWTVGILMGRRSSGKIVIADVVRVRRRANDVQSMIRNLAIKDGKETWQCIPQDPGAAGKAEKESYIRLLQGYTVITRTINKNKVIMASSGADSPAALWQRGQVEIVRANWNKDFLDECDAFPTKGVHDDQVDALSSGIRNLPGHAKPDYSQSGLNGRFKEVRSTRRIR